LYLHTPNRSDLKNNFRWICP